MQFLMRRTINDVGSEVTEFILDPTPEEIAEGEYVTPFTEKYLQFLKAHSSNSIQVKPEMVHIQIVNGMVIASFFGTSVKFGDYHDGQLVPKTQVEEYLKSKGYN